MINQRTAVVVGISHPIGRRAAFYARSERCLFNLHRYPLFLLLCNQILSGLNRSSRCGREFDELPACFVTSFVNAKLVEAVRPTCQLFDGFINFLDISRLVAICLLVGLYRSARFVIGSPNVTIYDPKTARKSPFSFLG